MNQDRSWLQKRRARFLKVLLASTLLVVLSLGAPLVGLDTPSLFAGPAKGDKSDLNQDGTVDLDDLVLFSQQNGLDWMNVDWCQWIADNSRLDKQYSHLFDFVREYFQCSATVPILSNPQVLEIDIPRVMLEATIVGDGGSPILERGTVWNTTGPPITENRLAEGNTETGSFWHIRTDFTGLDIGTRVYFRGYAVNSKGIGYSPAGSFVVPNPLAVMHFNHYPTRLALGPNGAYYVSDPKVNSVFIYDSGLNLKSELKGLYSPLGVAVDTNGFIYVGNAGIGNVEKYDSSGKLVAAFGQGTIRVPSDLALDANKLYVADSISNVVWVFNSDDGTLLNTIRKGGLKSPMAVAVSYYYDPAGQLMGELFVADKGNYLVKVFDFEGNLLRSFGGFPTKGGMMGTTWNWKGKFISLQSLATDAYGNLHALDIYLNKIQILNPVTGAYISDYGVYGTGAGQLKLPLDIIINDAGNVVVTNSDNKRVEVIYTVP